MNQMIKTQGIERVEGTPEVLSEGLIGFLGSFSGTHKIRDEFNALNIESIKPLLADLGNIGVADIEKLCATLIELYEDQKPIVAIMPRQSKGVIPHSFWDTYVHPVWISNSPLSDEKGVAQMGIQKHFFSTEFDFDSSIHLRLGELRHNTEKAEVMLRTADCIVINLNVLRLSDNLGSVGSSTAGLMIEELCMIAKYAGASTNLRTIIIQGYDQNNDDYNMMAKNNALLLYYILDGFKIRQQEKSQSEQLQRYSVLPDHASQEMVFIEDQRSGRWWIELYSDGAESVVKMPCTRKDYEDACENHISERITSLLSYT